MFWNTILLAFRAMSRNMMRSLLTMLGIIIGVAAVVTMVTLGNGATISVSQQISSLGSNLIMVMTGHRMRTATAVPLFKVADAEAIATQISGVAGVAPTVSAEVTAVVGANNWKTRATGTTTNYLEIGNWHLASGRMFTGTEVQSGKSVCVIGNTIKRELFDTGDPIGADVRIGKFTCQIIGVLAAKGQSAMGSDQDDVIIAPLRTVQRRLTGSNDVSLLMVSAKPEASTARIKTQIESLMRERRNIRDNDDNNFNVMDTKEIAATLSGTTRILTMLLGAVAAVSLLVGGIGIMNIMLVSVTERTREIGIRLAIGAREREVLLQFMVEAIALSAVGGLAGIILAIFSSIGLSTLMDLPFIFDWEINIVAFLFSAFIGVLFGYMPARRAAHLKPIEALRHE